jgi:hypothetical protein
MILSGWWCFQANISAFSSLFGWCWNYQVTTCESDSISAQEWATSLGLLSWCSFIQLSRAQGAFVWQPWVLWPAPLIPGFCCWWGWSPLTQPWPRLRDTSAVCRAAASSKPLRSRAVADRQQTEIRFFSACPQRIFSRESAEVVSRCGHWFFCEHLRLENGAGRRWRRWGGWRV